MVDPIRLRRQLVALVLVLACASVPFGAGAQAPLPLVPAGLFPKLADSLALVRANLDQRLTAYRKRRLEYDGRCPQNVVVPPATFQRCAIEHAAILPEATALGREKNNFVAYIAKLDSLAANAHTNTAVVDARVPRDGAYLIAQVPELAQSPAADRIMKGYQAVIAHDWPVALAWWQEALQRDPANKSLQRSVDLAQWMVDTKKSNAASALQKQNTVIPVPPLTSAINAAAAGDNVTAIRYFEIAKAQNPSSAPGLNDMIAVLQAKEDDKNVWSKAQIQVWDNSVQSVVDGFLREALKSQAAGKYQDAQAMYMAADMAKMQLSTESPPKWAPRVLKRED